MLLCRLSGMFSVVLISASLYRVDAQLSKPCESPKQWEGNVYTVDTKTNIMRRARVVYDENAPRVRITEDISIGNQVDFYDVVYLHNVEYRLNLKTRQCNVTALTRPFRQFGVPQDANFIGKATIGIAGIPGENVVIENYNGQFRDGTKYFGDVTYPDCIPVSRGVYYESGLSMDRFYDINVGIADPMVFIPHKECAEKLSGS